jgi:hypothetical protein
MLARISKFMIVIATCLFIFWSASYFWPDNPYMSDGLISALPVLPIYFFDGAGLPGLLQNDGACGWGWCAPTLFGWALMVVFWLVAIGLLSLVIDSLIRRTSHYRD